MKTQKLTPLAPRRPLGQVVGDTLGSGPDVATWVRAGLVMCRHVLTGVDFCGSVYLLIGHRNALENAFLRAQKPENRLKTFCFCFLRRGPGPSEVAGGGPLTERSKTFRPVVQPLHDVCPNLARGYYQRRGGGERRGPLPLTLPTTRASAARGPELKPRGVLARRPQKKRPAGVRGDPRTDQGPWHLSAESVLTRSSSTPERRFWRLLGN